MTQALLDLDTQPTDLSDPTGFDIGWDHARHALVPPAELMLDGTPVSQGWRAARAVFGHRTVTATRAVRTWLALRLEAWRSGAAFEPQQVTPHFLAQLETPHCPVTRVPLGGAADHAPVITRLRGDAGFAAGNLVVLSRAAVRAKANLTAAQTIERADRMARERVAELDGLDAAAWARLATLMSLAVELPQAQAVRLPMRALPPNRVRVLNAAQGLQALLTLRLQAAGWSRRARAMADRLPRPELRHDFNLFVGALAARLMTIALDASPRELRWAQEDAWCDGRVQRRWALFAGQLSAAESERLLQDLAGSELGGITVLVHAPDGATDGWSLPSQGRSTAPQGPRRTGTLRPRLVSSRAPAAAGLRA